jgi:DNA recombination protein Rad52
MPFSEQQIHDLSAKLSAKHVRTRQYGGRTLSYIEGWHVIAEANRIFGSDAWDRKTMTMQCVWTGKRMGRDACSYVARVRIQVRAGNIIVSREGSGSGHGVGLTLGEAHERALKEAETDAMKRALTTFGNPFGLALYDREQKNVRGTVRSRENATDTGSFSWLVFAADGKAMGTYKDPVDYCSAVREQLTTISTVDELEVFWNRNASPIEILRRAHRDLYCDNGKHYADILLALYQKRCGQLGGVDSPSASSKQTARGTDVIDKTRLALSAPRRVRDRDHLKYVAQKPCLVCGRVPSQAHHLSFAQPKAMQRKVSDEWVVPLCAAHHRTLHDRGDEKAWWQSVKINPVPEAERLWQDRCRGLAPDAKDSDETVLVTGQ